MRKQGISERKKKHISKCGTEDLDSIVALKQDQYDKANMI